MIEHNDDPIFHDIQSPFQATRYHSLSIDPINLPQDLTVIAQTEATIMGIKHKSLPIYGFQFHPEAYLTHDGQQLITNFFNVTL